MGKRTFTTEVSSTALIASESQGLSHPVHIATYIARVCFNHASASSAYGWSGRPKCDPWSLRKRYGKYGVLRWFNQSENSLEPTRMRDAPLVHLHLQYERGALVLSVLIIAKTIRISTIT
jgi:hypothetical protein